ncbi:MAG: hypothetical protein U0T75_06920 [Chitinophagales bacterium]
MLMLTRTFIVVILLAFTLSTEAKKVVSQEKPVERLNIDSMNKVLLQQQAEFDSMQKENLARIESTEFARSQEQMSRNLDSFVAEQKEQQKKQLRNMYIQLGFGAAMLVILVVGLLRKRKKGN